MSDGIDIEAPWFVRLGLCCSCYYPWEEGDEKSKCVGCEEDMHASCGNQIGDRKYCESCT